MLGMKDTCIPWALHSFFVLKTFFGQGSQTSPHMKRYAEVNLPSLEQSSKDWSDGDLDYLIQQERVAVRIDFVFLNVWTNSWEEHVSN